MKMHLFLFKGCTHLPLILISVHTNRDFTDIVKMSCMFCGDHTYINLENRTEKNDRFTEKKQQQLLCNLSHPSTRIWLTLKIIKQFTKQGYQLFFFMFDVFLFVFWTNFIYSFIYP